MTWFSDAADWVGGLFGSSGSSGSSSTPIGQNMDGSFIYGPSSGGGGGGGDFFSSIGNSWIGRNWDNIGKGINVGRQLYNMFDMNSARQGVRGDLLDSYQKAMLADAAYQQQVAAYNQQQAAGAAAARRRTQAAQQKAGKKALKVQEKYLKELIGQYQPYADAAKMLTPKMAQNYSQYLDTTGLLNAYLTPKVMDQMGQAPKPAYSYSIPESSYSIPAVKGEAISFPTVEEMLKKGK